jgi:hypothetical protein
MVTTAAAIIVAAGIRRAMWCFHLTFMSMGSFRYAGLAALHVGVIAVLPLEEWSMRRAGDAGEELKAL